MWLLLLKQPRELDLSIALSRRGQSCARTDGFPRYYQLDAAIELAAGGVGVGGYWLRFAEAVRGDRVWRQVLGYQVAADGLGSPLGEALVHFVAADAIGVAFDFELQTRMSQDNAGDLRQLLSGAGLERVFAGVEQDVGHVDDQPAGGLTRLKNGVELLAELFAELGLFLFGLRYSLTAAFNFGG